VKLPGDYAVPPLEADTIHLWSFPVSPHESYAGKNLHVLSGRERTKADRFYKETDQVRCRVVYVLLREILDFYMGAEPRSIEIQVGDRGKPYALGRGAPFFNLSHSGNRVLFGFSREGEVGVDIELIKNGRDLQGLIDTSCSPNERRYLKDLPVERKRALFYQYWSAKEAYLKGLGTGMNSSLKEIDCSGKRKIGNWTLFSCPYWDQFSAAVATTCKTPQITLITDQ